MRTHARAVPTACVTVRCDISVCMCPRVGSQPIAHATGLSKCNVVVCLMSILWSRVCNLIRSNTCWPLRILRVQNSRVLSPGFCVFEPNMEVISSKYGQNAKNDQNFAQNAKIGLLPRKVRKSQIGNRMCSD